MRTTSPSGTSSYKDAGNDSKRSSRDEINAFISPSGDLKRRQDASLINAVVQGDAQAQDLFIAKYGRLIYHVIRQTGVDERLIEDLYQTVFMSLWNRDCRRLRQWSGRGLFTSYICTVVRRIAYDEMRRSAGDVAVESLDESGEAATLTSESPEAILEQNYYASAVSRAISRLRPSDARLIIFRHIEDMSYSEIGSKLDMSVNHVGVALYRGIRRMREILEPDLL